MRHIAKAEGIYYFPELVAYKKDANFIVFKANDVHSIMTLNVTLTGSIGGVSRTRVLGNTIKGGDEVAVDCSYTMTLFDDATTVEIGATVALRTSVVSPISFETRIMDGYTLPNRKHFDDTTAYVPPLNVFQKIHPDADKQWVEFGAPAPIVRNGEVLLTGDTFKIYSDGCDGRDVIDVPFNYNAWDVERGTVHGVSHVILDRVVFEQGVMDWLVDNNYISANDILLTHGVPSVANEAICSIQMSILDGARYRVERMQFSYQGDGVQRLYVVQKEPTNMRFYFEKDLMSEDYVHGSFRRVYNFTVEVGGEEIGNGQFLFMPISAVSSADDLFEAVRFMLNAGDDIDKVIAPTIDDTTPHYDYSGKANISGVGERTVELKCLQYGFHAMNTYVGEGDTTNLLWMPTGGGDGYSMLGDTEGWLYIGFPQRIPTGVPNIELQRWFGYQYADGYYRYDLTEKELGNMVRVSTQTIKRYNVATTQPTWNMTVQMFSLKDFVLCQNGDETEEFIPQTVYAVPIDNGRIKVFHLTLQKYDSVRGVVINCDVDGNEVQGNYYVQVECDADFYGGGVSNMTIEGSATVYDEDGNWLAEGVTFRQYLYYIEMSPSKDIDGCLSYEWLPFTCGAPALKRTAGATDVLLPMSADLVYRFQKFDLFLENCYLVDFDLGRTVVRNGVTIVPQPVLPQTSGTHNHARSYIVVAGVEMKGLEQWLDAVEETPVMKCFGYNEDDYIFVLTNPCTSSENDYFYSGGSPSTSQYTISTVGSCSGHIIWLRYLNHDGFERWMPSMILTSTLKATFLTSGVYRPLLSPINAFANKSVGAIEERMELVATEIPTGAHIEDMFMASNMTAFNEDGTLSFPATIEDEEVSIDMRKEADDYRFTILKKM